MPCLVVVVAVSRHVWCGRVTSCVALVVVIRRYRSGKLKYVLLPPSNSAVALVPRSSRTVQCITLALDPFIIAGLQKLEHETLRVVNTETLCMPNASMNAQNNLHPKL